MEACGGSHFLGRALQQQGHMELHQAECDLHRCASIEPQAEAKGLRFEVVVEPSVPRLVIADESRTKQAQRNLLANAVTRPAKIGVIRRLNSLCTFCFSDPQTKRPPFRAAFGQTRGANIRVSL